MKTPSLPIANLVKMAKNDLPASSPVDHSAESDWITVGQVVGAFGVHGEIKVDPFTSFPDRFAETQTLYAGARYTPYTVLGAHWHKRHVLLQLAGIDDMDAAERLRGQALYIPSSEIHELPDGQFYLHDVIGLQVHSVDGRHLGSVKDIVQTGGTDLFVVERTGSNREMLLPAVREFIKSVDVASGVMTVDPIPGLLDDDGDVAQ
jgi:16S rRNA processing protein RimM